MREDLRRFLLDAGVTPDDLERARREGWLALLVLDRLVVPGRPVYDVAAVADVAGTDVERVRRLWRAVGFPDTGPGLAVFNEADVDAVRLVLRGTLAQGSDFAAMLRQIRVISSSMARVASVLAEHVGDLVLELRRQGLDDETIAASFLESFDGDELTHMIDYEARLQLRAALWLRLARDAVPDLAIAIGFADLSGYTTLSAELDADDLAEFVARWEELVYDTVALHGARVVKTIGDEAMFVGLAHQVARIALALRDAARVHALPEVRGGIAAGMVVARDGDFYGPVVNLASRLTEAAPPGAVLAAPALRAELAGDGAFRWSEPLPLRLRGIGDTEAFELLRAAADGSPRPSP